MEEVRLRYPGEDDAPYLDWFRPAFRSVFVALTPFTRIEGGPPVNENDWLPEAAGRAAKAMGPRCGVTWAEVASSCGFASTAEVNQALRGTGSGRIVKELASPERTARLLAYCRSAAIHPPDEGGPSPAFELAMGAFLTALGQDQVRIGDGVGDCRDRISSSAFSDIETETCFRELVTDDKSVFAAIYIDYHYYLVAQTDSSLQAARPDRFFEGFYADSATNDFWGLPGAAKI